MQCFVGLVARATIELLLVDQVLFCKKNINGTITKLKSISFSASANTSYTIRFNIVGTTLSAKAWKTGTTEPTGWMITATDSSLTSGQAGLRVNLQSGTAATITSFSATAQ